MKHIVIIGAGPAGLTAAFELLREPGEYQVTLLEESGAIGGISRTVRHNGNRMDIGGHRFFSKDNDVTDWWSEIMPRQGAPAMDDKILGRSVPTTPGGPDPDEEDRDAVDKSHDIRPAAVQFAVDFQFLDGQKVVVQRIIKVKYPHTPDFRLSVRLLDRNRDAIPEIAVLLLIDLDQGGRGQVILQLLHRVLIEGFRQPGIQLHHSLPEVTPEHDFPIVFPSKGAVYAQLLRIVGIGNVPAQLVMEQISCTVLN